MKRATQLIISVLIAFNTLQAQSINAKLGGNTSSETFDVTDSGENLLYRVQGDAAALFRGTYGTGTIPVSGAGTRMMWYPKKAAFRVGYVVSTRWDDGNMGSYSVAMGKNTQASGTASTALGNYALASGYASTAMGMNTIASGSYSTAMGDGTHAGDGSTAMGSGTLASGDYSTAMGRSTEASGDYSAALGLETTASGNSSTAMGNSTTASGYISTAMGELTTASGYSSTAMGYNTKSESLYSVAIGRYNVGGGSPNSYVYTDPIFEIGIGDGVNSKKNALTVLKTGNVGIGTS